MEFMIDENLQEVFSNLDALSLINASLVCKRWSVLITSSAYLMRCFDQTISISTARFKVQNVFPNGKYQNLTIINNGSFALIADDAEDFIKRQNECFRNITIRNFDRQQTIQVLSCLSNVTKLTISNFQSKGTALGLIDMPNLRHLELHKSILFADALRTQSVKFLKIFGASKYSEILKNQFSNGLNNLLKNCSNLKELTLSDLNTKNPNLKCDLFKFNLEALTIENFNFEEENLLEFLIKQRKSLKKLAIQNSEPKNIISIKIFTQLSLDELEIDVGLIPKVFNPSLVNSSIKKLTLRSNKLPLRRPQPIPVIRRPVVRNLDPEYLFGMQNNQNDPFLNIQRHRMFENQRNQLIEREHQIDQNLARFVQRIPQIMPELPQNRIESEEKSKAAEKIISACRSVESFKILDFTFDSLLQQLFWTQTNLKILKIQTIPKIISPTIQFNKLEVIEIDQIQDTQDVENCTFLVIYSPNLKTLKINSIPSIYFESKFFITIINKARKLREFHIGTECKFTSEMITAVRILKDCGRPLRILTFKHCSIDSNEIEKFGSISMNDFKLNLNSVKLFLPMINETQLGRIKREIDEKNENWKQQVEWSKEREFEIETYEHYNSVD